MRYLPLAITIVSVMMMCSVRFLFLELRDQCRSLTEKGKGSSP